MFLIGKMSIFIRRNSVKVQNSHYLGSYKKFLIFSPYSKKRFLNGKKSIFI